MRDSLPKIVIVALLLLVVGLPFVLRAMGLATETTTTGLPEDASRLVIYSPHNEQIRDEMSVAFNRFREREGLPPVRLEWRTSGGTSDLRRGILSQFTALAQRGGVEMLDEGIGADLFYGGGDYDHGKLADGIEVGDKNVPVAVAPRLRVGLLNAAFPKRDIGGEALVHPEELWIGTALSSFGLVYNRDLLAMLEIPEPTTWEHLADPRFADWIAMADPGHSGSISAALETVLRRQGWNEGWSTLRRIFANSRYFSASASKVPLDVARGDAAAGMAIDFYGRFQAGATKREGRPSKVGYADPQVNGVSQTATTADPITLLRGAPERELAEAFIAWTLSKEAQALWQRRLDDQANKTTGFPERYELRRQPIRPDLYTENEKALWTDPQLDPFGQASPFPEAMPSFFSSVAPVSHAIGIDIHDDLKAAWATIRETPDDDPRKAEMLALFEAMPEDLTLVWPDEALAETWAEVIADPSHPRYPEAEQALADFKASLRPADRDEALANRLRWTQFFGENYRAIAAMGE
ncbi:MAG: extracellular solute-binding protein [Planctomycetota bacterium]